MLPLSSKIAFLIFALITLAIGLRGFYRLYLRIRRGRPDSDLRFNKIGHRLWYAISTSLTQKRTFRDRALVSTFHSFIFYGFVFYLLVNLVDAIEGYLPIHISSGNVLGSIYNLLADILSFLVLVGVIALVIRRFALPARRSFRFNASTLLHPKVRVGYIYHDSLIVSAFILFHVGSRALEAGARIAGEGADPYQPFATLLSHLFSAQNAVAWRVFGYWGALGSVLLFLAYFPYTKHIHIFAAPLKYFFARESRSGVLPLLDLNVEDETKQIGVSKLEDLAWPRLLDAYACIQCNRCQDVCPATATGKSLSPAALEINKRMELNQVGNDSFDGGAASPQTLLQFALTREAAWACTTCGACMEACPVQDEQMLDIIDIRRNQVMMEGSFPSQLQTAFRGMERNKNPWGINHEQRLAWADGLDIKTTEQNAKPDVLYWVGCAASYDPQAQKTARAFVKLLDHAGVDFAVLGKKECCTGDTARRAGNELLYRELADQNVSTLNEIRPKLVVASCPHCMNALGSEYKQIGGDYKVMHHTEYLDSLLQSGKIATDKLAANITYHDPCYLGRHNDVYEAPRNLLKILGNDFVELERTRNNAFCCGAGGAQFWKEEEHGSERISENRFKEVQRTLAGKEEKTLAVGCPFCKSMLGSTPGKDEGESIAIRDVAELLWEGVQRHQGIASIESTLVEVVRHEPVPSQPTTMGSTQIAAVHTTAGVQSASAQRIEPASLVSPSTATSVPVSERKKWQPKQAAASMKAVEEEAHAPAISSNVANQVAETTQPERKKWTPRIASVAKPVDLPADPEATDAEVKRAEGLPGLTVHDASPAPVRKKWEPKKKD